MAQQQTLFHAPQGSGKQIIKKRRSKKDRRPLKEWLETAKATLPIEQRKKSQLAIDHTWGKDNPNKPTAR